MKGSCIARCRRRGCRSRRLGRNIFESNVEYAIRQRLRRLYLHVCIYGQHYGTMNKMHVIMMHRRGVLRERLAPRRHPHLVSPRTSTTKSFRSHTCHSISCCNTPSPHSLVLTRHKTPSTGSMCGGKRVERARATTRLFAKMDASQPSP